jgi:hypothetical protein
MQQPIAEMTQDEEGHDLLVLRGAEGAVTIEAWWYEEKPIGILVIHSRVPMHEGQPCDKCAVLGRCYMDASYADGFRAAPYILSGDYDQATAIAYGYYATRLCADPVPS